MSAFDGTWRPDPQRPGPDAPAEELLLADGTYTCLTCHPRYRIPADGQPHSVEGSAGFDSVAITVVDERTVRRVASRDGSIVLEATTIVAAGGTTKTEIQRRLASAAVPFDVRIVSERIGPAPDGTHAVSGRWRPIEVDLVNHEEDTVYRVVDGVLSMRDGFRRAFDAPLDGTEVPYRGDARFTTVSLRQLDDRTIEEVDRNGSEIVLTTRWHADPDGRTMHVRFEHASGLVQEQDGHRIN